MPNDYFDYVDDEVSAMNAEQYFDYAQQQEQQQQENNNEC